MSNLKFTHTDLDGDTLTVSGGDLGAVVRGHDGSEGDRTEVAVRYESLPALIETLQAILDEEGK